MTVSNSLYQLLSRVKTLFGLKVIQEEKIQNPHLKPHLFQTNAYKLHSQK